MKFKINNINKKIAEFNKVYRETDVTFKEDFMDLRLYTEQLKALELTKKIIDSELKVEGNIPVKCVNKPLLKYNTSQIKSYKRTKPVDTEYSVDQVKSFHGSIELKYERNESFVNTSSNEHVLQVISNKISKTKVNKRQIELVVQRKKKEMESYREILIDYEQRRDILMQQLEVFDKQIKDSLKLNIDLIIRILKERGPSIEVYSFH